MRRTHAGALAVVILAGLMLAGWAISGQEQAGATVEKFSANIMVQGGGAPAGRSCQILAGAPGRRNGNDQAVCSRVRSLRGQGVPCRGRRERERTKPDEGDGQ